MAGPQEILAARYARRLQRKFSLKGQSVVVDVGPEIIAVVQADPISPEDFYLADERLCIGLAFLAAGAGGTRAEVELLNPAGSGVIVVVEQVINQLAAQAVNIRLSTSAAFDIASVGGTTKTWRDTRIGAGVPGAGGTPSALLISDNTHALVAAGLIGVLPVNPAPTVLPFVLGPRAGLTFEPGADATSCQYMLLWRERPLEPSEV